jgi:hypothetical protein
LINELNAANEQLSSQPRTRFRRAVMRQATRQLDATRQRSNSDLPAGAVPQIIVCASGNLAHIYFDIGADKVTLSEIEHIHPRLVQALVQHEGIGFVAGYTDNGEVVALGKCGARNLHTGAVTGADPLAPFGDGQLRAAQLLRIAEFTNAGDLILNSTVYPDGTVASFEDLIGVHGGLGGQQTDAFIVFPTEAGLQAEGITNSSQVYTLLWQQRQDDSGCTA